VSDHDCLYVLSWKEPDYCDLSRAEFCKVVVTPSVAAKDRSLYVSCHVERMPDT